MAYKKGDPLVDTSRLFRLYSWITFHITLIFVRILDHFIYHIKIEGRKNLKGNFKAFLISNHTLFLDPAVLSHAIRPHRTYFTLLEETVLVPFLGTLTRLLGGIPVSKKMSALRKLEEDLPQAFKVFRFVHMFPEGECYRWNQEVRRFFTGVFRLALKFDLPIVPLVTVMHEQKLFGRNKIKLFGKTILIPPRLTIMICEPVSMDFFRDKYRSIKGTTSENENLIVDMMIEYFRTNMQKIIDSQNGDRSLYQGHMPRFVQKFARE
jgi:1-acyl-sn-glycerol-3-phosphate acyltransferase